MARRRPHPDHRPAGPAGRVHQGRRRDGRGHHRRLAPVPRAKTQRAEHGLHRPGRHLARRRAARGVGPRPRTRPCRTRHLRRSRLRPGLPGRPRRRQTGRRPAMPLDDRRQGDLALLVSRPAGRGPRHIPHRPRHRRRLHRHVRPVVPHHVPRRPYRRLPVGHEPGGAVQYPHPRVVRRPVPPHRRWQGDLRHRRGQAHDRRGPLARGERQGDGRVGRGQPHLRPRRRRAPDYPLVHRANNVQGQTRVPVLHHQGHRGRGHDAGR